MIAVFSFEREKQKRRRNFTQVAKVVFPYGKNVAAKFQVPKVKVACNFVGKTMCLKLTFTFWATLCL